MRGGLVVEADLVRALDEDWLREPASTAWPRSHRRPTIASPPYSVGRTSSSRRTWDGPAKRPCSAC